MPILLYYICFYFSMLILKIYKEYKKSHYFGKDDAI
nr:MAG TPA: hypothetical protein [Caudoviricetes sp.]